jgi:rhodanese-related sulfurtransferase
VPLDALTERSTELEDGLERPMFLVCRKYRRSAKAAQILTRRGFADVHVVAGGMEAWNVAGLPVKR